MSDPNGNRERLLVCLVGLMLAFGTLATYWPVRHFDFVNIDDGVYVTKCGMVQQGLSRPGLVWAFRTFEGGNWNPLIWVSHMVDCQIYGLKPGGHHVTNLLLHLANVLLLFHVLSGMTGAIWRSGFAAAIFAWHPLHVESVAWISERKDVLSTLFWLLTMWAYLRFVKTGETRRKMFYLLAVFFFALGLMCKPMLVTLPCVLWLLDYWPLRRVESVRGLALEKLPFLGLSLAASMLAVWAQKSVGALAPVPMSLRLENVVVSYATYVAKFFWPADLAVFYPYPDTISIWKAVGAFVVVSVISLAVIWRMKQRRYLAVGWFWFLGTLVPVIGLVQLGLQALADRYTYIPYIGLALMISWGIVDLAGAWPCSRTALAGVAALALGCCLFTTSSQLKYWRNNTALYEHALKVTSGNYVAYSNLGAMLLDEGKLDEAEKQFAKVIQLKPQAALPYSSLGTIYAMQDKLDDAMAMFLKAIAVNPALWQAHYNLATAYKRKGNLAQAIAEYKTTLRLKPDHLEAQEMLGEALLKSGKFAEALPYCEAAVQAEPGNAHAHFALATALLAGKRVEPAVFHFKEALRLSPDTPECMNSLAWIYATSPRAEMRNGAEAVRLAEQACQITKRQNLEILDTLAAAYAEAGRYDDAIKTISELRHLALSSQDAASADRAWQRLELYQAGKPYRDEL